MSRNAAFRMLALAAGCAAILSHADKTYPGCNPLDDKDFRMVSLMTRTSAALEEPLKMAFDMDNQGRVDIYFVERKGRVRKFSAATKEVQTLGTVAANTEFEGGLTGIALDPAFKTNKWMYLYYGNGTGSAFRFRVSRFTLDASGQLDAGSEKILLAITAGAGKLHTGGAMAFDSEGNLFVTVGDNAAGEGGPGNTNDLRGKILRIKPTPEGGYTIPAGNLFPAGTALTRPEIYVMGTRNAYSLQIDPLKKWVVWGDVGPDMGGLTEEHNLATQPGNHGYPFYAGNQIELIRGGTTGNPVNNSPQNTGMKNLPPARPATRAYEKAAAITGPVYRYNPTLQSQVKFPPHLDEMWFVTDFNTNTMDSVLLDATGSRMVATGRIFNHIRLDRPLDFQVGPDGALYVINYSGWFSSTASTNISRIEYTGTCRPGVVGTAGEDLRPAGRFQVRGYRVLADAEAVSRMEVIGVDGRTLGVPEVREESGMRSFDFSGLPGIREGVYLVKASGKSGVRVFRAFLGR